MSNPYPNRDLEELYIENSSVWEEVSNGGITPEAALDYMQIPFDSDQWDRVRRALLHSNPPL